jgi:hypothetical protein
MISDLSNRNSLISPILRSRRNDKWTASDGGVSPANEPVKRCARVTRFERYDQTTAAWSPIRPRAAELCRAGDQR